MTPHAKSHLQSLLADCPPFSRLSRRKARDAFDAVQTFELTTSQQLTLAPGSGRDRVYILKGRVRLGDEQAHAILNARPTPGLPYSLEPDHGPLLIQALEDSVVCRADAGMLNELFD